MTLSELHINQEMAVSEIEDHPLKTKLLEMGFRKGKLVKLAGKAPLGDPLLVELSGYKLMIRKKEAQLIKIAAING